MVLEELDSRLPTDENDVKNAYASCEARKKFVEIDKSEFTVYLEKSKSDLERVEADYKTGGWDWVVVKSYYSMHHAANALLARFHGVFSKDHTCAILALKALELIPDDFYERLRVIHSKFSDFTAFDLTYLMRKVGQYDVHRWKEIDRNDADMIYSLAKEFVGFAERRCHER